MNRRVGQNLLLSLSSILVMLCLLEVGVRLLIPIHERPAYQSDPVVGVRFVPGQEGTYTRGAFNFAGHYDINNEGWNSPRDYFPERGAEVRIAAIGDSFVEALQVDVGEAFPDVLDSLLNASPGCPSTEVYRFAITGAPLSHYLGLMRYVEPIYHPDWYVVLLINNDFDESLSDAEDGRYFWRLRETPQGFEEIPPAVMEPQPVRPDPLIESALVAFIDRNLAHFREQPLDVAPDIPPTPDQLQRMIRYVLTEMNAIAPGRVVLIMDFDRRLLYGDPALTSPQWAVARPLVEAEAAALDIPIVDIEAPMRADYAIHQQPFDFPRDYHWNERAHRLVAETLAGYFTPILCAD
jgi:hypothetical protein